jgi:hypothetical protein
MSGQIIHDQTPLISCQKHSAEVFTNYCCVNSCLTPLCPDCIDDHNKNHKNNGVFPEVDTLGRVKFMCVKHIDYAVRVLEGELATVIQHQSFTVGDWINLARKNLELAKQRMHGLIDQYFSDLLRQYQDELSTLEGRFNFKPIRDDLETILRELKLIDSQLKGNQVFQGIKSTVTLDVKNLIKVYQTKVEDALDISHNIPIDVDFSEEDCREFAKDLRKYISINRTSVSLNRDPNSRNRIVKTENDLQSSDTTNYFKTKFRMNN